MCSLVYIMTSSCKQLSFNLLSNIHPTFPKTLYVCNNIILHRIGALYGIYALFFSIISLSHSFAALTCTRSISDTSTTNHAAYACTYKVFYSILTYSYVATLQNGQAKTEGNRLNLFTLFLVTARSHFIILTSYYTSNCEQFTHSFFLL